MRPALALALAALPACLLLRALVDAQPAESLADKLYLRFLPPNEAAQALTPAPVFTAETPIVIRYTLIGGIAVYEARAACHPTALSFFGVRDSVPPQFCNPNNNAILASYTTARALSREYPRDIQTYVAFLKGLGLDPESTSTDRSTLNGWANYVGDRLADFFAKDGWNALGDLTRQYNRVPFEDTTNYRPVNNPYSPSTKITFPLRWHPLPFSIDALGRSAHQIHVVPHIGFQVSPLVLSQNEFRSRVTKSPYTRTLAPRPVFTDRNRIQKSLNELFRISARLTGMQRFFAQWFNNKLLSIAGISAFYEFESKLTPFEAAQQFMGEMLAQHDAVLLAFREKRRHDVARPRTLLQFFRPGQRVRAFVDETVGVRFIRTDEWRPFLPEQPHSEFPSASSATCEAAFEHIEMYHRTVKKRLPTIKIRYPAGGLPIPTTSDVTVAFNSPTDASQACSESRLWGGVHLRPATVAGRQLGKGIGEIAFRHIMDLGMGKVPQDCMRCMGGSRRTGNSSKSWTRSK